MINKPKDGGPAFACAQMFKPGEGLTDEQKGMTVLQWYVGQIGSNLDFKHIMDKAIEEGFRPTVAAAKIAYDLAEEFVAEGERRKGEEPCRR